MDQKIKQKWIRALRSGRYKQTQNQLHDGKAYCCLGVLCRVVGAKYQNRAFHWNGYSERGILPDKLRRELKITPSQEDRLTIMNDGDYSKEYTAPQTFKQIADYIEKYL